MNDQGDLENHVHALVEEARDLGVEREELLELVSEYYDTECSGFGEPSTRLQRANRFLNCLFDSSRGALTLATLTAIVVVLVTMIL